MFQASPHDRMTNGARLAIITEVIEAEGARLSPVGWVEYLDPQSWQRQAAPQRA